MSFFGSSFGSGSKSSTGSSMFGSSGGFGFGSQQKQEETVRDPIVARLRRIRDAYDPKSTSYRFQVIVYNTKKSGGTSGGFGLGSWSSTQPESVKPEDWTMAKNAAPSDKVEPHVIKGFKELKERAEAQQEIATKMREKLSSMKGRLDVLKRKLKTEVGDKIAKIQEREREVKQLQMEVCELKDVNAFKGVPFNSEEEDLMKKLESLESEIERPNSFTAKLNMLGTRSKLVKERMVTEPELVLTDDAVKKIQDVLEMHTKSLMALTTVVKSVDKQMDDTCKQVNLLMKRFVG